jgi:UDP-glucose 4-epimerase
MNILVTGGAGFIGTHLVAALREEEHDVWLISRQGSPASDGQRLIGDLVSADLERLLPREIDVIYHLAGMGSPAQCHAQPARGFEVNVTATHRLLEAVRRRPLRRFVFVSSAAVYGGRAPVPTREDVPLDPTDALGATKAAAELLVRGYGACYQFPVTVFRLYTVYGPRSGSHQVIPSLITQLLRPTPVVTVQDPRRARDFLEIRDAVSGLLTALSQTAPAEIYNLGTGIETSVGELCALLSELMGRDAEVRASEPDRASAGGHAVRQCADITRAMTVLGWRPRVSLREGLAQMLEGVGTESPQELGAVLQAGEGR